MISEEKERLGVSSQSEHGGPVTYITVSRERILEDGYQQLGPLSALSLKGTIRVKFVNKQVCSCSLCSCS